MDYFDFEVEIGPGSGRDYPVAVIRSPAGEARETMHLPFGELELQNRLQALQIALLRSGGQRRLALSPEQQAVQDFGQALFNALLAGEARSRYDVSRQAAAQQGRGLRFKLRILPPELAVLPWEFMHDPRQAEYVCLSRHTPVVRYIELPQPIQPFGLTPPLRILGMVASPRDLPPLKVDNEKQRVERAIGGLRTEGVLELTWLEGQTWRDLQRAMRRGPWHVFHFIGHGGFDRASDEGVIALADETGQSHLLHATQLGRLLADSYSLRLVVLNACEGARGSGQDVFSSMASILVRRGLPAVLAMQYEITDCAAIELARAFYEALADGLPVDAAVSEARKAISLAVVNTVEWGTPVLYMRAPDGVLFAIQKRDEAAAKEPVPKVRAAPKARQPFEPELVLIPAGEFLMGSDPKKDKGADDDEQPQHTLYLPDYYLAKTPVTNAQYAAFVQAGHKPPDYWKGDKPPKNKEEHPVVSVTWHDAVAYCHWLLEVTGKAYGLPSEAEWEKGARGSDGRIYPWGDPWDAKRCNSSEGGKGDTTPVGIYPGGASPYGLLDMAGNVWEWTRSIYKGYPYDPGAGREDLAAGDAIPRVLRGGSFYVTVRRVRCAWRDWYYPLNRDRDIGFRLGVFPNLQPRYSGTRVSGTQEGGRQARPGAVEMAAGQRR